jgi:UDP-N-acetylmuramate: L-alanyl-gamma-D-glutamyl-meso-diaminopimelate ligase
MKVHLSAIAGTAMASLAGLLRERGHEVTGSDQDIYPPMSTQLEELGIPVRSPYAEENVPADADLVVIGNALSRGNPEVEIVLDRRQRMASLPQVLAEQIIRGHESLVVAGTHGKTTTTSMLAFLLDQAGLDPSFLIGGVPVDFERSYRLGGGPHIVLEGDEYDCAFFDKRPKFVHYMPDVAVIGNVEYDHADIYPDLASVQLAFARLIQLIPRRGLLLAGIESAPLREILPRALCRVETFGLGATEADWRGDEAGPAPEGGWRFRLRHGSKDLGEYRVQLPGEHNVRNAIAGRRPGQRRRSIPEKTRDILPRFRGVKRRLRSRGRPAGSSSTTTSRTIRRRCARRCTRCGWERPGPAASSRSSSPAPTPHARACSRRTSPMRSKARTRSSWPPPTCRARCRRASGSPRATSCRP